MMASDDIAANLVTYSLGSCVALAIYDPGRKVAGLLHFMLPDSSIQPAKGQSHPYMFANTGVPRLFAALHRLGAERQRLIIRVVGGAQFLDPGKVFNIGERNHQALLRVLSQNGHTVHAQDVGGVTIRTVRLDVATGALTIQSPGLNPYCL